MWDVLPIVLSGPDQVPQFFELPEEIILKIRIEHPDFPSMKQLNLEWFGLAMICDTFLECAGQQFPATAFSAMWTLPEIATRNLLDEHRYNLLKVRFLPHNNLKTNRYDSGLFPVPFFNEVVSHYLTIIF